ncbi:AraC family transcriptional regulator [Paenibacillus cymbidii]|uniref:AraC family transcriptional regulator n=1 Tax=Paenibacillus cymbidii TaxID=1639034 RepID=UPI00107FD771|nr:AraC family transcriptional regulator [Paenibacillus cymbidii]
MSEIGTGRTSKRFLWRLFVWFALTSFALVSFLSFFVYWNIERIALSNERHNNNKIIGQLHNNIASMYETVKTMANAIEYNNDAQSILFAQKEEDIYEFIRKMNNLSLLISYNPFLDSVLLYNGTLNQFYSTRNSLYERSSAFAGLVLSQPLQNRMRFIPLNVDRTGDASSPDQVLSFMMFESLNREDRPDGAVIVNIKSRWLQDNINALNSIGKEQNTLDRVYILDGNGKLLFGDDANDDIGQYVAASLGSTGQTADMAAGAVVSAKQTIRGQSYLVTTSPVPEADWTIVKVQDYGIFDRYLDKIKTTVLSVAAVFLLLSLLVSLLISRRVYRPFGNLVREVKALAGAGAVPEKAVMDEIQALRAVYRRNEDEIHTIRQKELSSRPALKAYYVRRMLLDSRSMPEKLWEEIAASDVLSIRIEAGAPHAAGVIRIDRFAAFNRLTQRDRELYKFAMENIIGECLSRSFVCEIADMKDDQFAFIAQAAPSDLATDVIGAIGEALSGAKQFIGDRFGLSLTAAISSLSADKAELQLLYEEALSRSNARFAFGHGTIITGAMTADAERHESMEYTALREKQLAESLKGGDPQTAEQEIERGLQAVAAHHPRHHKQIYAQWVHLLLFVLQDINRMKLEPAPFDAEAAARDLLACETMAEARQLSIGLIHAATANKTTRDVKHSLLVDAMKEMTDSRYADPDWFLQEAAELLKISPALAGKLFKEYTGVPFAEYVCEVRMTKAAAMLQERHMSIADVMAGVGIPNKSYFYRLFKKKYGVTPKEFALKASLTGHIAPK